MDSHCGRPPRGGVDSLEVVVVDCYPEETVALEVVDCFSEETVVALETRCFPFSIE